MAFANMKVIILIHMVLFIVNSMVILLVFWSPCEVKLHGKEGEGVTWTCYNLVYYFTLRMEIGYKEALNWRFSGAGNMYDWCHFSDSFVFWGTKKHLEEM